VERDPETRDRDRGPPAARTGGLGLLRGAPVILIPDRSMRPVVTAGLARAGGHPEVTVIDLASRAREQRVFVDADRAEVVLITASADEPGAIVPAAIEAESLGGRLLLTIAVHLSTGPDDVTLALLGDPHVPDTTVAVPSIEDDDERRELWDTLGSAADGRHHLVDVDGSPALAELADVGPVVEGDLRWLLAGGAAGVLAGRMVAGNRRWRPPPDA
jgi:hypothetical protein